MREHKYRAWDKVNNIMFNACFVGIGKVFSMTKTFKPSKQLENVIVMQYTGLKDKNGVEIYEGDIIVFDSLPKVKVHIEWRKENACFHFGNWYENCFPYTSTDATIIGNIYENPELLDKD